LTPQEEFDINKKGMNLGIGCECILLTDDMSSQVLELDFFESNRISQLHSPR
jgi:hypothetical protein